MRTGWTAIISAVLEFIGCGIVSFRFGGGGLVNESRVELDKESQERGRKGSE